MIPNVGDTVKVWKAVMGREYRAEGRVEKLQYDRISQDYLMRVAGDWWVAANDIENRYEVVQPDNARCRLCGEINVEMTAVDIAVNYGEDGREDPGGCFTEHRTEWRCSDRAACRDRRREMWELSKTMARFADQEAAERGAFAIGGGVG